MARDIPKGWQCPACSKPVTFDQLTADGSLGWDVKDVGRWYVKGRCPACRNMVIFTKQGGFVLRNRAEQAAVLDPPEPALPAFPVVIRRKGSR